MLYIHEKCTNDVQEIVNTLKSKHPERAKEFLISLIQTYQNIYGKDFNHDEVWNFMTIDEPLRFNISPIEHFPYVVLFLNLHQGKTIVLSVQYNRKSMTVFV